jgi:small-conductance mechanosensitive channel
MIRILAIIWLGLALSITNADAAKTAGKAKPDSQPAAKPPVEAMVVLEGKPLFPIKAPVYSFSPADRAGAVSERLTKLLKGPNFKVDSIEAVNGDTTTDIVAGDKVLMSVTDADAAASGKSRTELAQEYAQLMRSTIEARVKEYSAHSIAIGAAYAVAATIALIILIILLSRLLPRFLLLIESWKGRYIRSLRLQSIELLHQDRIVAFIAITAKTVRLILVLLLLNFYVTLVMSFFPWTREYSSKYLDYILNPLKNVGSAIISYLPKIFFIFVICVITHFVIKFTRFIFSAIGNRTITIRGFYPDWAAPTFNIIRFLIIMVAVVAAFPYLPGSESPAFKGISVFLGVLISLGSSSAISNIIAGVIITYTRAFKLGDRIQIGETTGDVVESNLLVTRIRTIKNVDITVPNSMVLGTHVINFSSSAQEYGLILHTTVTIGYDAPWRKVHELLISAAHSTENILELPAPFVLQTSLDDFYVSYQINAYTEKPSVMARTYSDLHLNIQERFNEAGVEIMSPHFSQLRDGNKTTIPDEYLPADYRPSAIRVRSVDRDDK